MTSRARASGAGKAGTAKPVAARVPRAAKPAAAPPAPGKRPGAGKFAAAGTPPRAAGPASAAKAGRAGKSSAPTPRTLDEFMTLALAMEVEAGQRYAEFADAMETHNNLDVATLFRKMAAIEGKHAQQIMAEMGWATMPAPRPDTAFRQGFEAPETAPGDEVHYLMQPYHALELALASEQRAERFFRELAQAATVPSVRKAARALQAEEREHVELVRAWMKRVPKPEAGWADDPDPPVYTD
jgi:rubrerythrin